MTVAPTAPKNWRGWNQERAGETRPHLPDRGLGEVCRRVGDVNVHAHRQRGDGSLVRSEPMMSIGPPISGTTGWTLMAGTSTMPADAATLRLHLTTDRPGTLWHDNVVVAEVASGTIAGFEHRRDLAPRGSRSGRCRPL